MTPKKFYSKYKDLELEIEKMKKQVCKYSSGSLLLNNALKCIIFIKQYRNVIDERIDKKNEGIAFNIINATIAAITYYCSCFNENEDLIILDESIFSDKENNHDIYSNQLSEREYHKLIMNYRNRIIAHNVNFAGGLMDVGVFFDGSYKVIPLNTKRVPLESINFYNAFENLVNKSLISLESKQEKVCNKLEKYISENKIIITNEEIQLMPIPRDDILPNKKFWGLA
jgi:hypothetical protein